MKKTTAQPLVVQGGTRTFSKDLTIPDPIPAAAIKRVTEVLDSARLFRYSPPTADLSETARLEKEFADYLGVKYALAVSSCSSAIFVGLQSMGLQKGDKVLMPAFTFTAVPSSIVHAGAEPVLVECQDNYCVDVMDLERKLQDNPDIKFFLLSHMRGHVSDMGRVVELCQQHNVDLVEDAAHSLGVRWGGQQSGTFGRVGCFSFQSTKMINAGEGGMLVTNDDDVIARAVIYSGAYEETWRKHQVMSEKAVEYKNKLPAYNVRMSEVTAAIARAQIPLIEGKVQQFRNNYAHMATLLNKSPFVQVPDRVAQEAEAPNSIQFNLQGLTQEQIGRFIDVLALEGIKIAVFGFAEDNARCFWNWHYTAVSLDTLPQTETMLRTACDLRLPVFLESQDIEVMGRLILQALEYVTAEDNKTPELEPQLALMGM